MRGGQAPRTGHENSLVHRKGFEGDKPQA